MWRRILDRNRHKLAVSAQIGISGVWTTFQRLPIPERDVAQQLAAEAVNWHAERIDRPVMTGDMIYRYAVIMPTGTLKEAYSIQLAASRGFESMNEVGRWVVPTLIQFCYAGELLRRQAWSEQTREAGYQVARVASDSLGRIAQLGFTS